MVEGAGGGQEKNYSADKVMTFSSVQKKKIMYAGPRLVCYGVISGVNKSNVNSHYLEIINELKGSLFSRPGEVYLCPLFCFCGGAINYFKDKRTT